jgi:hypothetical protein
VSILRHSPPPKRVRKPSSSRKAPDFNAFSPGLDGFSPDWGLISPDFDAFSADFETFSADWGVISPDLDAFSADCGVIAADFRFSRPLFAEFPPYLFDNSANLRFQPESAFSAAAPGENFAFRAAETMVFFFFFFFFFF